MAYDELTRDVSIDGNDGDNAAGTLIELSIPYRVAFELTGTCDLLFHRWNATAVEEKAKAAKNSKAKKTDDVQSYLYRNDAGQICMPGEYVRQSMVHAAKFRQDPRSPRKSAMDLYKAALATLTPLSPMMTRSGPASEADYEDTRRVVVQRSGINRTRPAFREGWKAQFIFLVLTPEYISPTDLHAVLTQAGQLVGVADFRPTFGRFAITNYETLKT